VSESEFELQVRKALHDAYHPIGGVFHNNKTGYKGHTHRPFGGPGAGDLIGFVFGLWIEVENKARLGSLEGEQKVRRALLKKGGCLYVVCHELGWIDPHSIYDRAIVLMLVAIDDHVMLRMGKRKFTRMMEARAAKGVRL
jgi:hypothetical protein